MMRISQGSLARLRKTGKSQVYPTTCYLMVGSRCENDCLFCAQNNSEDMLSRIHWPDVKNSIIRDINKSDFERVCLQCTSSSIPQVISIAEQIRKPLSISYNFTNIEEVDALHSHAERICIPLDCANDKIFRKNKKGSFHERLKLIKMSAEKYKNISTHLIVGLGESKTEMKRIIQKLHSWDVTIGLFAFTPIKGTALEHIPQPDITYYRSIQAFYHMLKHERLTQEAFQTTGCENCNRPYYNEEPGKEPYNYPRRLSQQEYGSCLEQTKEL